MKQKGFIPLEIAVKKQPQGNKKFLTGFTLIELLVVVAIIGLLASVVLVNLISARQKGRDTKRIADIKQIQKALEVYINKNGNLPAPSTYGRSNVSPGFWDGWWDLSSNTGGAVFMNFLVTGGVMAKVPVDPLNTPDGFNGSPDSAGYRYIYYLADKSYVYQGGSCVLGSQNVYLLGITRLESDGARPPTKFQGSDCSCLWKNSPNFFQANFDYVTCGMY